MTTPPHSPNSPRSIVYVDGFNLYYGALAQTPYRWLNLERLAQLLRPDDRIQRVKYFTAMIKGPTLPNQEFYLQALTTQPLVEIVLGNFKKKSVECIHQDCPSPKRRFFQTHEEKRTDVNIAIHMLDDVYQNRCESIVLVSGDSDLVPAIEMVSLRAPTVKVHVYIPVPAQSPAGARERSYKKELRSVSTTVRAFPSQLFAKCQLSNPVTLSNGAVVHMPATWSGPKGKRSPPPRVPFSTGKCTWCGKS